MALARNSVGSIGLDMMLNYSSFQNQMGGIQKKASKLASGTFAKLGAIAGAAFSVRALAKFGKSATDLASELAEVQNVVDVAFGESAKRIEEFTKTSVENFGLSEYSVKLYTGTLGAMLKSMKISESQAADMSIQVAKLTGDFASFYDMDPDEIFSKIRSGIAGISMPLRQLGYNMTEATLANFSASQSYDKLYKNMTEAEKAIVRLDYLMYASTDAQNDFIRTSDSWANQSRIMKLRWDDFKGSFGSGLITLFKPVIIWLNNLIARMTILAKQFSSFVNAIRGVTGEQANAAKANASVADSLNDVANAQEGVGDSAKDAAKKAKGSLAVFDKLNVIGKKDEGSVGISAGVDVPPLIESDDASNIAEVDENIQGLANTAKNVVDNFKKGFADLYENHLKAPFTMLKDYITGNMWPRLKESFQIAMQSIVNVALSYKELFSNVIGDYFDSFVEALPGLLNQFTITFHNLLGIFDTFVETVSYIWAGFAEVLNEIWEKWGKKILDKIWIFLTGIWDSFNKVLTEIIVPIVNDSLNWLKDMWDKHIKDIVYIVLDFVATLVNAALDIWNLFIKPIIDWLIEKLAPRFREFFGFIRSIIESFIIFAKEFVTGFTKIFGGIIDFLMGIFTGDWNRAFNGIKSTVDGVRIWLSSFTNFVRNIFNNVIDLFRTSWGKAKDQAINALKPILNWLTTLVRDIKLKFNSIPNFFRDKFASAKDSIVSVFASIPNLLKAPINKIIDIVNNMIRRINRLNIRVPAILGGGVVGFNIPTIPRLAEGGIVDTPTLAMVGDNKRSAEAITPIHELQSMINQASNTGNREIINLLRRILDAIQKIKLEGGVYFDDSRAGDLMLELILDAASIRKTPWPVGVK